MSAYIDDHEWEGTLTDYQFSRCHRCNRPLSAHSRNWVKVGPHVGPPSERPTQ